MTGDPDDLRRREVGRLAGRVEVPDDFDEPDDELADLFAGTED